MNLTPFKTLTWAYQLHYYLCFRTHRRRPIFSSEQYAKTLSELIQEISANHDYRLLEQNSYPNQLRCLLSLRPAQTVAKAVQLLKSNSSRELVGAFNLSVPVWATGYLARSSGQCELPLFENTWNRNRYITDMPLGYCHRFTSIVHRSRVS
jgi:REP element-mobilizing transposase RayT